MIVMGRFNLKDLKKIIRIKTVIGTGKDIYFSNVKSLKSADQNSLVWIKSSAKNKFELILKSKAQFIICDIDDNIEELIKTEKCIIIVDNPKLEFIKLVKEIFNSGQHVAKHDSAIINKKAQLSENIFIGPNAVIGNCKIGKGSVIHGNCYIHDNVTIGANVRVGANTVIGSEGFAYSKSEEGIFEHFPHLGGVEIRDNVDIGSNTNICRGVLDDTIIEKGVKIGNLVHIAHNVVIGKNTLIISNTMIGGSVVIGDNTWVSPSVSIINQAVIGSNSVIGIGAVVINDIPQNETWAGVPARQLIGKIGNKKNK